MDGWQNFFQNLRVTVDPATQNYQRWHLLVALGILVDNAIVVTENATRFLKMGFSRKEAAIKGTDQIGWAIVSATATTVLAFVPIIMMRDETGDFIRGMPLTVVYTLTASLLIALTFTPFLSSKFLRISEANLTWHSQLIIRS